jgi:hypothetical protein
MYFLELFSCVPIERVFILSQGAGEMGNDLKAHAEGYQRVIDGRVSGAFIRSSWSAAW